MNYKVIFNTIGKIALILAVLLVIPTVLSASLLENSWWALLATAGISLVIGLVLTFALRPRNKAIFSKEGLIIVALSWIYVSAIGALPFVLSRAIPNYIDAFFETCSGFSTTGATILTGTQIESMDRGLLFWRSFTHWIGGMGVIVFLMAFESGSANRGMHILRAEMPGPTVDKIVPRARSTARILYLLYIGFTVVQIIALLIAGMPVFDSFVHAFGTAGTGGFGIKADSIASYNPACQWIIAVFMVLFGINFNLYYLLIMRKFRSAFKSQELWIFLGIIVVASTAVSIDLALADLPFAQGASEAVRHGFFQVASFISTTGYSSIPTSVAHPANINSFPLLSKALLFLLMFIGGCAGSTGGGLKVSRVAILGCSVRKELRKVLHPRSASAVKFEGKILTEENMQGVTRYFALYMLITACTVLILCLDGGEGLTLESNITASVSCLNNIGPAYGVVADGYYMYNWLSKIVLSFAMLIGRLELYPILLTFAPSTWIKR